VECWHAWRSSRWEVGAAVVAASCFEAPSNCIFICFGYYFLLDSSIHCPSRNGYFSFSRSPTTLRPTLPMSSVPIPRQYVTSTDELQALLARQGGKPVLSKAKVIGVHFQFATPNESVNGADDRVVAVVAGSNSPDGMAVVLQLESLQPQLVVAGLKTLLEDTETIKVLMDAGRVDRWLWRYGASSVTPASCVDLQLLYQERVDRESLGHISSHCGSSAAKLGLQVDAFNVKQRSHRLRPGRENSGKLHSATWLRQKCRVRARTGREIRYRHLTGGVCRTEGLPIY
jgi:hypothetical protein